MFIIVNRSDGIEIDSRGIGVEVNRNFLSAAGKRRAKSRNRFVRSFCLVKNTFYVQFN